MVYLLLKFLHVVGASVLLGTGAGIVFFMLMAHLTGKAQAVAAVARIVVIADVVFTASAVIVQPLTGLGLLYLKGYPLTGGWVALSIGLYVLTGFLWMPVVWMQVELRSLAAAAAVAGEPLPARYHQLFRLWFAFSVPGFASVLAIVWLMIARPALPWLNLT